MSRDRTNTRNGGARRPSPPDGTTMLPSPYSYQPSLGGVYSTYGFSSQEKRSTDGGGREKKTRREGPPAAGSDSKSKCHDSSATTRNKPRDSSPSNELHSAPSNKRDNPPSNERHSPPSYEPGVMTSRRPEVGSSPVQSAPGAGMGHSRTFPPCSWDSRAAEGYVYRAATSGDRALQQYGRHATTGRGEVRQDGGSPYRTGRITDASGPYYTYQAVPHAYTRRASSLCTYGGINDTFSQHTSPSYTHLDAPSSSPSPTTGYAARPAPSSSAAFRTHRESARHLQPRHPHTPGYSPLPDTVVTCESRVLMASLTSPPGNDDGYDVDHDEDSEFGGDLKHYMHSEFRLGVVGIVFIIAGSLFLIVPSVISREAAYASNYSLTGGILLGIGALFIGVNVTWCCNEERVLRRVRRAIEERAGEAGKRLPQTAGSVALHQGAGEAGKTSPPMHHAKTPGLIHKRSSPGHCSPRGHLQRTGKVKSPPHKTEIPNANKHKDRSERVCPAADMDVRCVQQLSSAPVTFASRSSRPMTSSPSTGHVIDMSVPRGHVTELQLGPRRTDTPELPSALSSSEGDIRYHGTRAAGEGGFRTHVPRAGRLLPVGSCGESTEILTGGATWREGDGRHLSGSYDSLLTGSNCYVNPNYQSDTQI